MSELTEAERESLDNPTDEIGVYSLDLRAAVERIIADRAERIAQAIEARTPCLMCGEMDGWRHAISEAARIARGAR